MIVRDRYILQYDTPEYNLNALVHACILLRSKKHVDVCHGLVGVDLLEGATRFRYHFQPLSYICFYQVVPTFLQRNVKG